MVPNPAQEFKTLRDESDKHKELIDEQGDCQERHAKRVSKLKADLSENVAHISDLEKMVTLLQDKHAALEEHIHCQGPGGM
jgi:DNA repair exonuclease SbcCD ATPase subunit